MPKNKPPSLAIKYVLSAVLRWQWLLLSNNLYNCSEAVSPKPRPSTIGFSVSSSIPLCSVIANTAVSMQTLPTIDVNRPILTAGNRNVSIAIANPTASDVKNSVLVCVTIVRPSAALIHAITIDTFHPCGNKKRSVDISLVPSSGALNGKFTIITRAAATIAIAAPMP